MRWISWLSRLFQDDCQRTPSGPFRQARLNVEVLEGREVLSTVSFSGGVLTVLGTPGDDRILVSLDSTTNQLVVQDDGRIIGRFASPSVTHINIFTGNGNDRAQITPQVLQAATIVGGNGKDVLSAGGGPTTIIGGTGTAKLRGGASTNTFVGGSGKQLIIGGTGTNTGTTGTGPAKVIQVKPTDTIVTKPTDKVLVNNTNPATAAASVVLNQQDVQNLLKRASAADANGGAIIAVVDRNGRILGVREDNGVSTSISGSTANLVFAVDGAVSLARTGAFFASDSAPLTSRTVSDLSQSTITEREVDSNPNITDPNSTLRGPGYVAPVRTGAHFPPGIVNTPEVDLFGIEHTNRDSLVNPGADGIKGTADDIKLSARFNIDTHYVPPGKTIYAPESYGTVSGLMPNAQSRGIATLPGGIPIYENGVLVGGIGVFYPGKTGYASEENSSLSSTYDPKKPDLSLEAEYVAFAAVGGSSGTGFKVGAIGDAPALSSAFDLPSGRIDLVGITLDVFGPGGTQGAKNLVAYGQSLGVGHAQAGQFLLVNPSGTNANDKLFQDGLTPPSGWLVTPHDGVGISAAQVTQIINNGITQANKTRAAIRLPKSSSTRMVFAVCDLNGNIVGLYRMPDATIFSIDVAVAKARNVNYYNNASKLQTIDQLPGVPAGVAFTNRTFRYLALPRYPSAAEGTPPGYFSILNDGGADYTTARLVGSRLPASAFQSVYGYDSFHPGTNFRDKTNLANQNGIVFFPGSAALYQTATDRSVKLIGGFGVSGDGVDQDDVVTTFGQVGYEPTGSVLRADLISFRGVRLPYQKYDRNPEGGIV